MSRKQPGGLGEAAGLFGGDPHANAPVETPHEHGHRERLKARFAAHGADPLPDYELLELVLFAAIPRRDVKPLAKKLIATFGDFNHAITAPPARLREVDGVGEAVIHQLKLVEAAATRLARARVIGRPALSSWSAVVTYCKTAMAHGAVEQFRVLYLDKRNVLIADEALARGTVDAVAVYPREVVKRALELSASAVILAHNHPSGDPTPSQADIDMTRQVKAALGTVRIALHDHLVIGKDRDASLHALGLL